MPSIEKAREYVHANGTLWERALWNYLFDNGPVKRVHQCLRCYKIEDNGWGHGLEHDIKTPDSNPLQLEYLLFVLRDTGVPPGDLLDGSAEWLESMQNRDGSLQNPKSVLEYPHAPWWQDGGQHMPDSITGNLLRFDACTPQLASATQTWVLENLTIDKIRANEWLFMAYHAYDYFMNVADFPDLDAHRQATIENIVQCVTQHAAAGELAKCTALFSFAPTPNSIVAQAVPDGLVDQILDDIQASQQEDGRWKDEHDLPWWQPYTTIAHLLTLRNYDRL